MGSAINTDMHNLLEYYGETTDSPEASKPEDFFALILSFSSSLQVCLSCAGTRLELNIWQKAALEIHDEDIGSTAAPPDIVLSPPEKDSPSQWVSSVWSFSSFWSHLFSDNQADKGSCYGEYSRTGWWRAFYWARRFRPSHS